jgi:hypothetical protein
MVADIEEWVTGGEVLSYADDTTCYKMAKTSEEVRKGLTIAAGEIFNFMRASRLAANASKTKFIMFGRSNESPLVVGNNASILESKSMELLGITFNKQLIWKSHLDNLVPELRKRTGILRRLSWHLPKDVVLQMIEPIPTSKLRYGIEI